MLVGVVAVLLALMAAGCGSQQSPAVSLFGPFAGYSWHGNVRRVSAVVIVPQLNGCVNDGFAGTWIGAEGHIDPQTQAAPFFQVGVNEQCGTPQNKYYAFWSSTAEQFHPQWMLSVSPGDVIRLVMRRQFNRWIMTARDRSSGQQQTVAVDLGPQTRLGLASWHQEDVSNERTSNPFPYPNVGAVRFSAVRVNGRPPRATALTTIWMSAENAIYAPTPLASDAFSVRRVHPSAQDLHYQRLVLAEDLATYLFNARLASWSPATPRATIKAGALTFARALSRNIAGLRSHRWSSNVRVPIDQLIVAVGSFRDSVLRLSAIGGSYLPVFKAIHPTDVTQAGLAVKSRMHMGVTDPSLITIAAYVKAHSGS